jgi:AraC family transcriptional regulator, exoenzyme S synthesis regulatory protein ExsA
VLWKIRLAALKASYMQTLIKPNSIKATTTNALTMKGEPVIQYAKNCVAGKGSIYLEENILLFVLEGHFTFRYGKATYEVKKNQIVFLKKNILTEYHTSLDNEGAAFLLFVLKSELVLEFARLEQLAVGCSEVPDLITIKDPGARLLIYMTSLQSYFHGDGNVKESLVKIKLLELLFCLSGSDQPILEQMLDIRDHFRSNITRIVEENIMNTLTLNQLARLSGRSISSFRRDFLFIYNMSPGRWIRQKRLEKSKELLLSTNMTITNICYVLGFESNAHFSRLFKSFFGYPPSALRPHSMVA